jgi:hypothetical protein
MIFLGGVLMKPISKKCDNEYVGEKNKARKKIL